MNRILITPLDWGLGHATRCIPVIRELLKRGCTVFIAGNGDSLALLKTEFPSLTYFHLPGYNPVYSSRGSMVWRMAFQVPKFISVIIKEHRLVESLIQTNKIDLVISDNRYGCWSEQVRSIFMTHQINIQMPAGYRWLSKAIKYLNNMLLRKFSTVWIPDYPGKDNNLSGELSAVDKMGYGRFVHIGPLSRFNHVKEASGEYDVACVLSGPEPQRSIFEEKVVRQLEESGLRYVVVRGVLGKTRSALPHAVSFLNSEALQDVILRSSLVVARSGYSTIMDLLALRKNAIVVPTPGQTEQEYLADRWSKRGVLQAMTQDDFNLRKAMKESICFTGFRNTFGDQGLFESELDRVLTANTSSSFAK
jgi:uncharacterized protein (TIGR00661 family)